MPTRVPSSHVYLVRVTKKLLRQKGHSYLLHFTDSQSKGWFKIKVSPALPSLRIINSTVAPMFGLVDIFYINRETRKSLFSLHEYVHIIRGTLEFLLIIYAINQYSVTIKGPSWWESQCKFTSDLSKVRCEIVWVIGLALQYSPFWKFDEDQ